MVGMAASDGKHVAETINFVAAVTRLLRCKQASSRFHFLRHGSSPNLHDIVGCALQEMWKLEKRYLEMLRPLYGFTFAFIQCSVGWIAGGSTCAILDPLQSATGLLLCHGDGSWHCRG